MIRRIYKFASRHLRLAIAPREAGFAAAEIVAMPVEASAAVSTGSGSAVVDGGRAILAFESRRAIAFESQSRKERIQLTTRPVFAQVIFGRTRTHFPVDLVAVGTPESRMAQAAEAAVVGIGRMEDASSVVVTSFIVLDAVAVVEDVEHETGGRVAVAPVLG